MNVVHHGATTREPGECNTPWCNYKSACSLLTRPHLVHILQYNAPPLRTILKVIHAGVGFGSGNETRVHDDIIFMYICYHVLVRMTSSLVWLAVDQIAST